MLEKAELTLIKMLSKTKKVITTPPPVLCSIASCNYYFTEVEDCEYFHYYLCRQLKGGGMEIKMTITVAGNKKEYEEGLTVAALIEKEDVENAEYVTVTLNDDFVEKDNFKTTVLKEGDVVEFLYFMGGGAR